MLFEHLIVKYSSCYIFVVFPDTAHFQHIREKNAVYVDKTQFIHKLVSEGNTQFFLARPRKFGKSLLISTLDAFWSGKQELFEGLYIADKEIHTWEQFPIVKIDFNAMDKEDYVRDSIKNAIQLQAEQHNIKLISASHLFQDSMCELLQRISLK